MSSGKDWDVEIPTQNELKNLDRSVDKDSSTYSDTDSGLKNAKGPFGGASKTSEASGSQSKDFSGSGGKKEGLGSSSNIG